MITLITGTPGAGKTAWTVQELTRLPAQRKVYVHGIPELKFAHEPIYCTSELCDLCAGLVHYVERDPVFDSEGVLVDQGYERFELVDKPGEPVNLVEDWPYWATDGSLIVIDEVQRIWRPTNSSSKLSDDISRLETHRHRGLDFWLISQGPHLFHSNIRLLIGRHIHLVAKWNGRSEYEWPECRQNVTSRGDAVTRPYTLPKKVFGLYKSSSLHVKQTHRKPLAFYGLFACIALLTGFIYMTYVRVNSHIDKPEPGQTSAQTAQAGGAGGGTGPASLNAVHQKRIFPDFTPTVPGLPESAPAYVGLVKVVAAPTLTGCIKTKKECKCYTRQATPYPTTPEYCEEVMKNHRFNPYFSSTKNEPIQDDKPDQSQKS